MKSFIKFLAIFSILDGVWTLLGGKILIRSQGWVHPSLSFSLVSIFTGIGLLLVIKKFYSDDLYQ